MQSQTQTQSKLPLDDSQIKASNIKQQNKTTHLGKQENEDFFTETEC